jgi:thiamine biosynthesis lipoprotein
VSRHVIEAMGTVFSLDLRDAAVDPTAVSVASRDFHWVDKIFSTYRTDSAICLLSAGTVTLRDCPPEVAEVLQLCADATERTEGYFSARIGGRLDPTGLVKGWAVARAMTTLAEAGSTRHAINGGGDVAAVGGIGSGQPWVIGIADPLQPGRLLTQVFGTDLAVATSGVAERGMHILDPFTGSPVRELASVSVIAGNIMDADVTATAAFARGTGAADWLETQDGYEGLVVLATGEELRTSGFEAFERGP